MAEKPAHDETTRVEEVVDDSEFVRHEKALRNGVDIIDAKDGPGDDNDDDNSDDNNSDDNNNDAPFDLSNIQINDHYSLRFPSSSVRFRGSTHTLLETKSSQWQIERKHNSNNNQATNHQVTMKKVADDKRTNLNLLRLSYSLVVFFYVGFLFVFAFQVLLFLFMDLVVDAGLTDQEGDASKFIGALLSIPVFLYGLSSMMALAAAFLADVWRGHAWLRTVGGVSLLVTEWVAFATLLGIPLLTWIIVLFAGSDEWWKITLLTWFCCVTVYYCGFSVLVIYYETDAAWLILQELEQETPQNIASPLVFFLRSVEHRQLFQYSGWSQRVGVKHKDMTQSAQERHRSRDSPSLWARLTLAGSCCPKFVNVDPPARIHTLQDILGTRQFITRHNWSLERIFCSNQRLQSVTVVRGDAALLPEQMQSSFWCSLVGVLLVILLCVAGLVWMESSTLFITLFAILIFLCCLGRVKSTFRIYKLYSEILEAQEEEGEDDAGRGTDKEGQHDKGGVGEITDDYDDSDVIYQTFEHYQVSKPAIWFCWLMFGLEIGLMAIWPLASLFAIGNYPIAVLFLVLALVSIVRYYLNPVVLLMELGSFEPIGRKPDHENSGKGTETESKTLKEEQWKAQSRLFTILMNVTTGPSRMSWLYVFFLLAFAIVMFTVGSLSESAEDSVSDSDEITLLPRGDFIYEGSPYLPYPTCNLAKGMEVPSSNDTALADYAFLSVMAYQPPDTFQDKLDQWFGEGVAYDDTSTVYEFRQRVDGGNAAVSYRLVTFSNELAVVVVRGSTTSWEWMTDAQLWSGAALVQIIRAILPIGEVFTPIIHQLLKGLSFIESDDLNDISLYKQTTQFVQEIVASGNYSKVHITGQSLGGGISLITGAQTGIPAVAISGPNNKLSRKTFDPPFKTDQITNFLFNVLPERDIVPKVDDVGMQNQEIQCRAKKNDLFGCHSSIRSLCEILYSCGSHDRPPLCECATKFGYPEAEQVGGNVTYTDVCGTCRTNDGYYSDCSG